MSIVEIKFDTSKPPAQDKDTVIKIDGKVMHDGIAEFFYYANVKMEKPLCWFCHTPHDKYLKILTDLFGSLDHEYQNRC